MADGDGGGGREEWLRVYRRMVAVLRKSHRDVEALLADRTCLEALLQIQQDFFLRREAVLRDRLHETRRVEDCLRRGDAAKLDLLLDDKDLEVRRHRIYIEHQDGDVEDFERDAEHQDGDVEDFERDADALAEENNELKIKLKEAESCAELSEPTTDPEHSGRDLKAEIRKLKKDYKALSSQKETEVSALLAEKDFVWNQLKTMEKDHEALLKKKKMEAAQASEAAEKLQQKVEELQLQVVAQKKDDDIGRLQAQANDANMMMLALVSEKDDEIQKLKRGHLQASQKLKKDISGSGTHRRSRSVGPSVRGKSEGNPRRQMVEEDQPETGQKRQCPSSLSTGVEETTTSNATEQVENSVPKLDMQFLSEEEAYSFYSKYAYSLGFSIRRDYHHKVKNSSTIQLRAFTCSCGGVRNEYKREEKLRCGCDARMKIRLTDGIYRVYEFEEAHNHSLATVADPNNMMTTSSEQNERPAKPKGMKEKEKEQEEEAGRAWEQISGEGDLPRLITREAWCWK